MEVSIAAAEHVLSDSPPTYAQMDCYKFVRQSVRDAGGEMAYAGANDVYRNGVTEVIPMSDAVGQGRLKSGWALFIVEPESDTTPAKYRGDGMQDASHMGLYTDMHVTQPDGSQHYVEVAHSSASKGGVVASTLKNGWNWAGMLKDVDYSDWEAQEVAATQYAMVDVPEGENLRMRETPSSDGKYMLKIPRGAQLEITAHQNGFGQTRYYGHVGWVDERFLRYLTPREEAAQAGTEDGEVMALLRECQAALDKAMEAIAGVQ